MGLPPGPAETPAGDQFPLGRTAVPGRSLSGARVTLLRVHGTKSPKSKWRFTKAGEDWFCFAGLWRPMPEGGQAFTLLTTDPSEDVAPIHNRQMVILEPC